MLLTIDHHKPAVLCVLDPRTQRYLEAGTGRWIEFGATALVPLIAAAAPASLCQYADVSLPHGELIVIYFEASLPGAPEPVGACLGSTLVLDSPPRITGVYQR